MIEPYLRRYLTDAPNKYSADLKIFLKNTQLYINRNLNELLLEITSGLKCQLALKVSLKKH